LPWNLEAGFLRKDVMLIHPPMRTHQGTREEHGSAAAAALRKMFVLEHRDMVLECTRRGMMAGIDSGFRGFGSAFEQH
jgi:hypothetical protein